MAGVNKAIIVGNVVRVESREIQSGIVVNLCIATNDKYKNKQNEIVETTEWHNCTAFGRTAEIIKMYVQKGHKLYVEGSIKTEKYTDKNGVERTATKIMVKQVQLLGGKEGSPNPQNNAYANKDNGVPFDDDIEF